MAMFSNDPFGQLQSQQDQGMDFGRDLPGRIMSAEYGLSVQQGNGQQAANVLARTLGQWLADRSAR
jgi:hypothetical protein